MYMSEHKKRVSVPKDFGLLDVCFTEYTRAVHKLLRHCKLKGTWKRYKHDFIWLDTSTLFLSTCKLPIIWLHSATRREHKKSITWRYYITFVQLSVKESMNDKQCLNSLQTALIYYINLLAGLWTKKWTYCKNPDFLSELSFKNAPVEKVHGKVFVSIKWFKWLNVKVIWRSQCGISE